VCILRGINLNYNASKMVYVSVIRDIIPGNEPSVINVHTENKIKRKEGGTVTTVTKPETKMYRISFFKRRRLGINMSVPFGYKEGEGSLVYWAVLVIRAKRRSAYSCYRTSTPSAPNAISAAV